MPLKKFLGLISFNTTPLAYALIHYYMWRYARDRGTAIRAMIIEFAQRDPKFDAKDFLYFVDKKIRPKLENVPWATPLLDRDIDILLKKRHTSDTIIFHEMTAPEDGGPAEKKPSKARSTVRKSGSVAKSSVRAVLAGKVK